MAQLLSLNTITKKSRNWITLDGKKYDILSIADFPIQKSLELEAVGGEVDRLIKKGGKMNRADVLKLDNELGILVKELLPSIEPEMIAKLKTLDRLAIANAFTVAGSQPMTPPKKKAPGRAKKK